MAHKRRVTKEGRVNIPVEYLEKFRIQEDDYVTVDANRQCIMIKKFRDTNVCAITGKTASHGKMVGEVFISEEGLEQLKTELHLKEDGSD